MLGFVLRSQAGSHEHYVGTFRGSYRKVTVDCPKAPFTAFLIASMARQAGLSKSEFYAAAKGQYPQRWP